MYIYLMASFISSIMDSLSTIPRILPSTDISAKTTPSPQIDYIEEPNEITHRTIRITDDLDSLIQDMTDEIKISETIILKKDTQILEPKQLIKLQKYKSTLNKLIHSLQHKIQSISNHSIEINNEMVLYLNESLQNVRILNNLCNKIYDDTKSTETY
jgi:hypothetical protein